MLVCWILAAAALLLALVAFAWGRKGRLSLGHTTAWLLAALFIFAAALAGVLKSGLERRVDPALFSLLVAVLVLAIVGVAHSVALTRLDDRLRRMAQALALMGGEGLDAGRPRASGSDKGQGVSEKGPGAPGGKA